MTALGGGEVQGKVSAVVGFLDLRAQAEDAGGEDLADLGKPLGGGHQVGVDGVLHVHREDHSRDWILLASTHGVCHPSQSDGFGIDSLPHLR